MPSIRPVSRRLALTGGALMTVSALTGGCQDYLFEQKCRESVTEAEISRGVAEPTPADVLFVVDNSGSMADEQENLAANFDRFLNQLAGSGDYRIGVVTTDRTISGNDPGERGGVRITTFTDEPPYSFASIDDSACTTVGIPHSCFRGPDENLRVIDSSRTPDPMTQLAAFRGNVRVGSCGDGQNETGLNSMMSALQMAQNPNGACNQNFLRPNANLVIILVSDENDADPTGTSVDQYVTDLVALKSPSQIRVAVIVGSVDGRPTTCRTGDDGNATDMCGSLCRNRPPEGSHTRCRNNNECPQSEFCQIPQGQTNGECENETLRFWNAENCGWCSYYNVEDCCSALAGHRYVDFARKMETRIAMADPSIEPQQCRGAEGTRIACLIDSICQENFGQTLTRIARDLIIDTEYVLSPPAEYPPGVRARIIGGRHGEAGIDLENGVDFTVTPDGGKLSITTENPAKVPGPEEKLEIFYVSETEDANTNPIGACGVPTSTTSS